MGEVFFSYKREDRERVEPLVRVLEAAGFDVWWDPNITPGERFSEVIDQALSGARCVVVAWSHQSVQSPWVRDEAATGRDSGILVPLSLDGAKPPLGFREFQTPNFESWRGDESDPRVRHLVSGVRRVIYKDNAPFAPARSNVDKLPKRSRFGLIAALTAVLIIILALSELSKQQAPVDPNQQKPKVADRGGQPSELAQGDAKQKPTQLESAAQRLVLYEEDPSDPQGKRYVGSAIWRTETITPGPGATRDIAVHADLEIPERRITMTFALRRNIDQALPASHTIEITFNLPVDFPFGGIQNVPGVLMKQAEQTRGAPLAGLAVKVTSGFFLIGLSNVKASMQNNIQLLKERPWFDIPIVYNNGRRAILALEKGTPGEKAFDDAFKAWGQ